MAGYLGDISQNLSINMAKSGREFPAFACEMPQSRHARFVVVCMEEILREYEVRLLDEGDRLILIVPLIAGSEDEARVLAAQLVKRESAARFLLKPQLSSRNYRAKKTISPPR
jgi:hypothetical protein